MSVVDPIINKIINTDADTYVIFFVHNCPYCENALNLLRKKSVKYKGYDINSINGGMSQLLNVLNENASLIAFDSTHQTKPIIFLNGKFLGGYDNLREHFINK